MITPEQCLAGLFFLAAALALVGFLGDFFAMAHVRLVIPPAKRCQGAASACSSAAKFSRARCLFCFFYFYFKTGFRGGNTAKTERSHACSARHRQGNSPLVCDYVTRSETRLFCIPVVVWLLPAQLQLHSRNLRRRTAATGNKTMASRALAAYAELSTKRPYAVAFGSCAVKGVIADTISQRIVEGKQEQNWKRTAVFAFYGGWYCGWFQHALV